MMNKLIRDTILSILADKRADGEVLPFATSIEVAERTKMPVSEVEVIAFFGLDGDDVEWYEIEEME